MEHMKNANICNSLLTVYLAQIPKLYNIGKNLCKKNTTQLYTYTNNDITLATTMIFNHLERFEAE